MDQPLHLTLQLVRACKMHHRKSLALSSVISAIIRDIGQAKLPLSQNRIEQMISGADQNASEIVSSEFARLEQTLLDGADPEPALREYLDRNL